MRWKPWQDFAVDLNIDIPEITEPPCKHCRLFKPKRTYYPDGKMSGVQICHKPGAFGMSNDFSCYEEIENEEA